MKITLPAFVRWILVVIWMGVIFAFSHQAHSSEATATYFGDFNVLVRKLGHISEFAVLFFLLRFALLGGNPVPVNANDSQTQSKSRQWQVAIADKTNLIAMGISVLYAASDEWHQSFVPGRSACVEDVLLDSAAVLGAVVIQAFVSKK